MGGADAEIFGKKNLLSLASAAAISIVAFLLFSHVSFLQSLGYPGIFIISLVSSATVFLPLPGFAVVFAMGQYLNPVLVGLAAGLGSGIGELSGYLAGLAGHNAVERTELFRSHKKQVAKYGPLGIFVLAVIPNPAFDVAGIAAGAMQMPVWQFLLATAAGKTIRYIALAYIGGFSAEWF
jgi:membrane protein YqaA with SNARE-associated domain